AHGLQDRDSAIRLGQPVPAASLARDLLDRAGEVDVDGLEAGNWQWAIGNWVRRRGNRWIHATSFNCQLPIANCHPLRKLTILPRPPCAMLDHLHRGSGHLARVAAHELADEG